MPRTWPVSSPPPPRERPASRLLRPAALLLGLSLGAGATFTACRGGDGHRGRGGERAPAVAEAREPPPLLDLLASRALCLVYEDEALVVDGAPPDLYKFMDGGWKSALLLGERDASGRRPALADGQVAVLRLGGLPEGSSELSLQLSPARDAPAGQAMTVLLNERPLQTLPIAPAPARYRLPIPAGRALPGENQLRLFFRGAGTIGGTRSAAVIEQVTVGRGGGRGAALEPQQRPGRAGSYGVGAEARPALIAARRTRWSCPFVPPEAPLPARLLLGLGAQAALSGAAPSEFSLRAARDGEPERELRRERLEPGRWRDLEVDLTPLLGQKGEKGGGAALRLDLVLSGPGALSRPRVVPGAPAEGPAAARAGGPAALGGAGGTGAQGGGPSLASPSYRAPAGAAAPLKEAGSPADRRDAAPFGRMEGSPTDGRDAAPFGRMEGSPARAEHIVVIAVDALRADRLDRAGDRAGERPAGSGDRPAGSGEPAGGSAFARLLARGVRLRGASPGNYPLPAHASLLSGTYPAVHRLGVGKEGSLDKALPLLPELLARAGFSTGLFSGSGYVSERFGLARGFDAGRNLVREGLPSSSSEVWKLARPWLEAQVKGGRRAFLYLASADPHAPYTPPPGFQPPPPLKAYAGPLRGGVSAAHLLQIRKGQLRPSPQDRAYLEALYDAEVAQTEATVGAVVGELERLGVLDRTAILLVGTHGEELFDHGSVGHGHSLHGELVEVPVVLAFPPRLPPGARPPLDVELVDLSPTLLHLAGAAVPETMQGESLLPLLLPGAPAWPRPALSEHGDQLQALALGRYKLIISSGDRVQLFDRLRDPGEQRDVSTEHPIALRALRGSFALLHAVERRWQKSRMGTAASLRDGAGL